MASAAHAGPMDVYFERAFMRAADQRCRLLTPEMAAALGSAGLQARGAALRAGTSERDLAAMADRAETAAERIDCGSADLRRAADRVRAAFAGYTRMAAMRFPGELSGRPIATLWPRSWIIVRRQDRVGGSRNLASGPTADRDRCGWA
jgi:hypothetical protein